MYNAFVEEYIKLKAMHIENNKSILSDFEILNYRLRLINTFCLWERLENFFYPPKAQTEKNTKKKGFFFPKPYFSRPKISKNFWSWKIRFGKKNSLFFCVFFSLGGGGGKIKKNFHLFKKKIKKVKSNLFFSKKTKLFSFLFQFQIHNLLYSPILASPPNHFPPTISLCQTLFENSDIAS